MEGWKENTIKANHLAIEVDHIPYILTMAHFWIVVLTTIFILSIAWNTKTDLIQDRI